MACENCTCEKEKCLNKGCTCENCTCKFKGNDSEESKHMAPYDR
jgi:hypothetical protein